MVFAIKSRWYNIACTVITQHMLPNRNPWMNGNDVPVGSDFVLNNDLIFEFNENANKILLPKLSDALLPWRTGGNVCPTAPV